MVVVTDVHKYLVNFKYTNFLVSGSFYLLYSVYVNNVYKGSFIVENLVLSSSLQVHNLCRCNREFL